MNRYKIGFAKNPVEWFCTNIDTGFDIPEVSQADTYLRLRHIRVVCAHTHARTECNLRNLLSDTTETNDTKRFALDLKTGFVSLFQFFEISSGCQFTVTPLQHTRQTEKVRHGKFSYCSRRRPGGIEYLYPPALGILHVNIVKTNPTAGYDFQVLACVYNRPGYFCCTTHNEHIVFRNSGYKVFLCNFIFIYKVIRLLQEKFTIRMYAVVCKYFDHRLSWFNLRSKDSSKAVEYLTQKQNLISGFLITSQWSRLLCTRYALHQ